MLATRSICALSGLTIAVALSAHPASAAPTTYPLTLNNCGVEVNFEKAPERAIALGQNSAEIMLLLGLEDQMAGTAFWPNRVLPQVAEANEQVKLLTVESPSLEAILAEGPDFVAAQLPILLGPDSKVMKREDLDRLGIPGYLSPGICATTLDTHDAGCLRVLRLRGAVV